ncbi:MAG: tetratricopeptide repeat protein [Alphaproteobacteria bacterium]|nr:tetratricopeptide repeat protein [Alphaproteobacteria bacterium]
MIPDWLSPPPQAPLPDAWLERAWARLQGGSGMLTVVGPPDTNVNALAAALAARHEGPVFVARLAGCQDDADVIRAIGAALDLPVRGDVGAVAARLSAERTLVVLADADGQGTSAALESIRALTPGARFLLTGQVALIPGEAIEVPRATPRPLSIPEPAPPLALALAHLPGGVPQPTEDPGLPPDWLLPVPGRLILRRAVAQRLLRDREPEPDEAATLLEPFARELLASGVTRARLRRPAEEDLRLLRFLAWHHPASETAVHAACAAARLLAEARQPSVARETIARARQRRLTTRDQAMLDWADGDILLSFGLVPDATRLHRTAAQRLRSPSERGLLATLLSRTAAALAALGYLDEAERRLQEAHELHADQGRRLPAAEALRSLGDLALARGDALAAEALYNQAAEQLGDGPALAQASLALGRASLAVVRGEPGRAEALLAEAELLADGAPLSRACVTRRRADLRLRQGRHAEAEDLLADAVDAFRHQGCGPSAAAALRLRGDIAAAAGRPHEATAAYGEALHEAARAGDLVGARRTLTHLLALERIGRDASRVEELLALIAELDTELGHPDRVDGARLRGAAKGL